MNSALRFLLLVLSFVGLPGGVVASNADVNRLFAEAQTAFEQADALPVADAAAKTEAFRRAASRYQAIVDHGFRSGVVYYNLGNARVRADEPGQAIAAYLSAKRYLPLDPYLEANLRSVIGPGTKPSTPIIEHVFFWQNLIGYPQKFRAATILGILTVLAATTLIFLPHRRTRQMTLFLLALTTVASLSAVYDWYRFDFLRHGVVAIEQATPRKGNSLQYEPAFTTPLPLGSLGIVTDQRGDWLQLRFDADREAWLPREQVVVF